MAGVQGSLQVYSNDGQTLLYSSNEILLNDSTFVITQTGFTDDGVATSINYGMQISGWSNTQGATVPDYTVNTQYIDADVISPTGGSTVYIVPVQENKFVTTEGLNVLVNKIKQAKITSINGLSGGTLTSPLVISGGDAASASKIILNTNGQITDTGTATLFGRSGTGSTLLVGHSSFALTMRGSATRPTYNSNDLALLSDVPTDTGATSITTSGTGNAVTSASYDASTRQITLNKGSTFLKTAPVTSVAGLTGAVTASNLWAKFLSFGGMPTATPVSGNYLKNQASHVTYISNGTYRYAIAFGTKGNSSSDIQSASVSFGVTFTYPPVVVASMYWESGTREYTIRNLTTTGCTIYANGATRGFFYIAIGRVS